MVWPVQCVPVRGRDSLVPVHPDCGSVFGFAGFTLAHVSFGIPWLACCCLPLEDCGCVVRSGLGPLITLLANLCQPGGLTLASFAPFPKTWAAIIFSKTHLDSSLHLPNVLLHFRPTMVCSISLSPLPSLILSCSLDNNNSY